MVLLFIRSWAEIAQSRMETLSVEERLHRHIVVALAFAAHADLDHDLSQECLVGPTGILAPAIRVVKQATCGVSIEESHAQGLFH
jgi:hypothetical protein